MSRHDVTRCIGGVGISWSLSVFSTEVFAKGISGSTAGREFKVSNEIYSI